MFKLILEILENIPNYEEFLTVDELDKNSYSLAEKYPNIVEVETLGYSRNNNPLNLIKIGTGKRCALLYGSPHPNEPIGTLMLDYLAKVLAENKELREKLDYTFLIIKTVDPDGTKLNEGWFKGEINLQNYAKDFYRPEANAQVDWTFPINYKELRFNEPIPETLLLMKVIDKYKPTFMYPLHNAGFGGTYWYISEPYEHLYRELYKASERVNIPLHLGEPEMPFIHKYAPAIFKIVGTKQVYDYMEPLLPKGINPSHQIKNGTCSHEYAENFYQPFSVMTELPYFISEQVSDLTKTTLTRKESLLIGYKYQETTLQFIEENLLPMIHFINKEENPFYKAIQMYINSIKNNHTDIKMVNKNPEYENLATKAEVFDTIVKSKFYKGILAIGVLYRLSKYEIERSSNSEDLVLLKYGNEQALNKIEEIAEDINNELDYKIVSIKDMISVQLETGLLFLNELKKD